MPLSQGFEGARTVGIWVTICSLGRALRRGGRVVGWQDSRVMEVTLFGALRIHTHQALASCLPTSRAPWSCLHNTDSSRMVKHEDTLTR